MSTLKKIVHKSKSLLLLLIVLGMFNGLLNSGLLFFINNTIIRKPLPYLPQYDWLIYIGLIVSSLICAKVFQMRMIKLTNELLFEFELDILNRLKYASFQDFEKLGNEKVYTAIEDNRILGHLPEVFMNAFNSGVIAVCCFAYLFWISFIGGLVVLSVIIMLLLGFYIVRNNLIEKNLEKQRELQSSYYKYLNDLLLGFRELKISLVRNTNIYEKFLIRNRSASKDISISNSIKFLDNELTGTYSWFLVLGVIMFVLSRVFDLNSEKTTAFLVTILYLIGPVAVLITLIPTYTAVKVSMTRLRAFNATIGFLKQKPELPTTHALLDRAFESIRFEEVTFKYQAQGQTFSLAPLSITIRRGEVVFVTGGNGSGKSTFGYLLTGLYKPASGKIYLNEVEIMADDFIHFSNKISAIFTNNYLFSENYNELDLRSSNSKLMELIELMELRDVIKFDDDANHLGKNYSKGQQKRLALIYALLENKSVLLLDEWAAEQDPTFRGYFYKEILPILKRQGKTVVAITHDDEYFRCASRMIKFDYGKVISDSVHESYSEAKTVNNEAIEPPQKSLKYRNANL